MGWRHALTNKRNVHVLVKSDNTTAVAYLYHMGGSKALDCDKLPGTVWMWGHRQEHLDLCQTHVPGAANIAADEESRIVKDTTEWHLNPEVFHTIAHRFGQPSTDLFANRLNAQIEGRCCLLESMHSHCITLHGGGGGGGRGGQTQW